MRIGSFLDNTARFLIDPCNKDFSPMIKRIAWIVTILTGITTLGIAQGASALWRKLRHIEEKNETHEIISNQFKKIISKKEKTEGHQRYGMGMSQGISGPQAIPVSN